MQQFGVDNDEDIARTLAMFGAFTEGMQLFASFAMLMNFPRFNKMKGMGQIVSWSVRDESLHCEGIVRMFHEFVRERDCLTKAVKEDMESDMSMDRLICGDVGFGKTEVAMRAGFKAISQEKQMAVLVPTTVARSPVARQTRAASHRDHCRLGVCTVFTFTVVESNARCILTQVGGGAKCVGSDFSWRSAWCAVTSSPP